MINLWDAFQKVENRINASLSGKFWVWKAVFFAILISAFFYVLPNLTHFIARYEGFRIYTNPHTAEQLSKGGYLSQYWDFIKEQADEPLKQRHYLSSSDHESNMTLRLWMPFLMKIAGGNLFIYLFFQFLGGLFQTYFTVKVAYSILKEKAPALFFATAIAGIYFGNAYYFEIRGYGDSWVFFSMTMAVCFRQPILIFIATQIGFWTDERGVINLVFVILWWLLDKNEPFNIKKIIFKPQIFAIGISLIVFFALRLFLDYHYHLTIPSRVEEGSFGPSVLKLTYGWVGGVIWNGYEGFLALMVLGSYLFWTKKQKIYSFLLFASIAGSWLVSFMVYDSMRSITFTGIVLFIFLRTASRYVEPAGLKLLLFIIAIINLLAPSFY